MTSGKDQNVRMRRGRYAHRSALSDLLQLLSSARCRQILGETLRGIVPELGNHRARWLANTANDCLGEIQALKNRSFRDSSPFEKATRIGYDLDWHKSDSLIFDDLKFTDPSLSALHSVEISSGLKAGVLERLVDYLAQRLLYAGDPPDSVGSVVVNVYRSRHFTPDVVAMGLDPLGELDRLSNSRTFAISDPKTRARLRSREHRRESRKQTRRHVTHSELAAFSLILILASSLIAYAAVPDGELQPTNVALIFVVAVTIAYALLSLLISVVANVVPGRPSAAIDLAHTGTGANAAFVVPVLLHPNLDVEKLCELISENYLTSELPSASMVLLTDFEDRHVSGDTSAESAQLDDIITQFRRKAEASGFAWMVLHRHREYCPRQGVYMGRERKRGKLDLLNRVILGESGLFDIVAGCTSRLSDIEYVIVIDEDSRLAPRAAMRLLASAMHPLNKARIVDGCLRGGYSVFAPAQDIVPTSRSGWRFSKLLAGSSRRSFLFDLFAERQYSGKGVYRVSDFSVLVHGKLDDDSVLSHDVVEGFLAGTCHVQNALLVEPMPNSYQSWCERNSRWIRGDFQNLFRWLGTPQEWHDARPVVNCYYLQLALMRVDQVAFPFALVSAAYFADFEKHAALVFVVLCIAFSPAICSAILGLLFLSISPHSIRKYASNVCDWLMFCIVRIAMSFHVLVLTLDAFAISAVRSFTGKKLLSWRSSSSVDGARTPSRAAVLGIVSSGFAGATLVTMLINRVANVAISLLLACWILFPLVSERLFIRHAEKRSGKGAL